MQIEFDENSTFEADLIYANNSYVAEKSAESIQEEYH